MRNVKQSRYPEVGEWPGDGSDYSLSTETVAYVLRCYAERTAQQVRSCVLYCGMSGTYWESSDTNTNVGRRNSCTWRLQTFENLMGYMTFKYLEIFLHVNSVANPCL